MTEIVVPDVAGEIIGWRAWIVGGSRKAPFLCSPVYAYWWPLEGWARAFCVYHESPPVERCRCGIYAAASRALLDEMGYPAYDVDDESPIIIGEVGLAGKVIPGARGYRAERARPLRLLVPYDEWRLVDGLRHYLVPVELHNTLGGIHGHR